MCAVRLYLLNVPRGIDGRAFSVFMALPVHPLYYFGCFLDGVVYVVYCFILLLLFLF